MLNLSTVFEYSAKDTPDKTAIVFGDKTFTYAMIQAAINQVANALRQSGIQKGDRVVISCPNLPYFPMIYYGILKVGAVVVPINVLLKAREIAYHLKDSQAKAYFCFQGTPELPMLQEGYKGFQEVDGCKHIWAVMADPTAASPIEGVSTFGQLVGKQPTEFEMLPTQPQDPAVVLYTSGTTGFPKGAELSHSNMTMNALAIRDLFQLVHDDILIAVLPLFHSFGQTAVMNAGFSMGNTIVCVPRFTPDGVLETIQSEEATVFVGVPTMYWAMLTYKDEEGKIDVDKIAKCLRLGVSGGASMPAEILKGVEEKYHIPILEGYGLSETSPAATFNDMHKERKIGSVGVPIWGVEVMVVDKDFKEVPTGEIGEIVIRGPNIMTGYLNNEKATQEAINEAGWFFSGDLGKKDDEGYIFIVDRVKDLVIRGAFNVYPREIEEVLLTHEAVSLVSVIGVPDEKYGEEIKAFIVLNEGVNVTEHDIIEWAKENMASYKYPRIVEFREALPMTATGKILKKELRAES